MPADPTQALFFGVYAAFNLLVALLLLGVRPQRLANGVASVIFASNAVQAGATVLQSLQLLGSFGAQTAAGVPPPLDRFNIATNAFTYAAFLVFPFVFPRRRLKPRAERALLVAAAGWVFAVVLASATLPFPIMGNHPGNAYANPLVFLPFFGALAVGAVLLLDTALGSPSAIHRTQASFILIAYVMKIGGSLGTLPPINPESGVGPVGIPTPLPLMYAEFALLAAAAAAVPLGVLAARLRHRGDGPRTRGEDAFLLGMCFLGLFVLPSRGFGFLEYFLIRPFLFAYAILRYQLLDVDVRERWGIVAATLLAGMAGVFVGVLNMTKTFEVDPAFGVGVGFVATLGAGALLAWPLVRGAVEPPGPGPEPRGRELYRAALEEAVAATTGHDSTQDRVLRALRAKLQISDREHAVMEAVVRASFGKPAEGMAVGQRFLGRYRVEELLGEGGFGRTFLAHDEQTARRVVLKAARAASEEDANRLLREARVVARLHHPNVVTVFDVEQVAGDVFLVMEYVDGGSLASRLRAGPMAWKQSLPLLEDVLAGLEAAHAQGILHRDIKPANILLTARGGAKLADFGVARAPKESGTMSGGFSTDGRQPGSVPYMSPEQVRGKDLDARSDLYAVGVVWYEMLAGQSYLNLRGRAEFDARLAILEEAPKLPLAGVPREVNALLGEVLAKDPARRPASAAALRARVRGLAPRA